MHQSQTQITEELYREYFRALVAGNRLGCSDVTKRLLDANVDIRSLYVDLFQRSLYEIGSLWEQNKVSVATEHIATSITEGLLFLAYPILFSTPRCGLRAVVACVANEYHQVGAKMVADLLELRGWDTFFVGANTPVQDLLRTLDDKKPDVCGLSVSISFNLTRLLEVIEAIGRREARLNIIVGGQAFRHGGVECLREYPWVTCLPTLDALEDFAKGRE